jgi:hypothetical protein
MSRRTKRRAAARRQSVSLGPLLIVLGGALAIGLAAILIASSGQPPIATIGGQATAPAAIEVNGAPSLQVDRDQVDLGNVRLGETVSVSFELANTGDQPLYFTGKPYVEVVEGC